MRNRLAAETSPYLLAHADNPVEWYPWGEEALVRARRENKPILLSVGYSACHWCHVMAHESFEDPATAGLMNRWFVNVKVDREERPDLDKVYQVAQQLLTQRAGGWPLTMFLSPDDRQPFFGGTYFPKDESHGLPGFQELLRRVAEYYRDHSAEIRAHSAQLAAAFAEIAPQPSPEGPGGGPALDMAPIDGARAALRRSFDTRFGGFGGAPKFPHPENLERCLRDGTLDMLSLTLTRMAEGGIYDQLGGGFARYSVDASWTIPHFEKMLYDNGPLLGLYATAAAATGETYFARIAAETGDFLLRDMHSPEGGFYSSLDADSEGHEGKFYVWNRAEVESLLTPGEYRAFAPAFGLDGAPNFEQAWHLRVHSRPADLDAAALIESARSKLKAQRDLRVWPARDEKILTAWNALTIKGLAIAARSLDRPDFAEAATRAVDFIHRTLWHDGALLATYKDGRAHLAAYLDDYAFLAEALLELLQTRWRSRDLHFAQALAEALLARFEDREAGGFFFTASDHESLIYRSKTFHDESVPSGNGVAASVLGRLGVLLGEPRYLKAAGRTLEAALPSMRQHPQAHLTMLAALEDYLQPLETVIIRGSFGPELDRWVASLGSAYAPSRMIFGVPADAPDLPAAIQEKRPGGATVAYQCIGTVCSAPLTSLEDAAAATRGRYGA